MSSNKPYIIQVAGYFPPHLGGMERVVQAISVELAKRQYDVTVLTSSIDASKDKNPSVRAIRMVRLKAFELAHTPFAPGLLAALLRIPKYSIIHLHLAQAYYPELVLLVSKVRRIPYVVHFHLDLQPSGFLGPLFLLYKAVVLRAVIRQAKRIIVFSPQQQAFIHRTYQVAHERIAIIPNGVDEAYSHQPRTNNRKKKYNLLYVGRLSSQKRVAILIEALSLMKIDVTLTLVGDGEDRTQLERLVRQYRLTNVHFVGIKHPSQLIEFYRKADVFVIASEREGMPLAVLEAMAAALPIVGADVPGIRELIQSVGNVVARPSGPTFATTLDALLQDSARLSKLSRQSFTAAQNYTWVAATDALEMLYKELLP